jgi:peptide/nickel transport system ATP-binding protein
MINERFSASISAGRRPLVATDTFEVATDRITFLFGESGIGKSMLSKAVYGLLDPLELNIAVNGRPYAEYLNDPGTGELKTNSFFVFQEPSSHLNSLLKISEQLSEGSLKQSSAQAKILSWLWGQGDADAPQRILDVFPKPYRPSGGEKQRVLLAMAFEKIDVFMRTARPNARSFFVFDEPTGSLDNTYRNLFLELLFQCYTRRPFTVMIITHDYSVISELYAKYRTLLDRIRFKELRRTSGAAVEVVAFSADEYLSWLSAGSAGKAAAGSGVPVLDMNARFKVFGRSLCLYRDVQHSQPANLVIHKGEMVYVKAPSGVGKTTLAKVIMGLYKSQKCTFGLCGIKITERTPQKTWPKKIWGKKAGMVFQHADEALDLQSTVKETFDGLPLDVRIRQQGLKNKLLELFEGPLTDAFLAKKVGMLSGGQKQRLNLLRTLSLGTDLLILDEPLNGLDFVSVKKVLSLLEQKREQGSALLMISHNEEIFDHFVDSGHVYYLAEEVDGDASAWSKDH